MKFLNRKKQEMILKSADLLAGVGDDINNIINDDENFLRLPDQGSDEDDEEWSNESNNSQENEDEVEEIINPEEIADELEDILEDARHHGDRDDNQPPENEADNENQGSSHPEIDNEGDDKEVRPNQGSVTSDEIPELTSEADQSINIRPTRTTQAPEKYNPVTGKSYRMIERCHNIITQAIDPS